MLMRFHAAGILETFDGGSRIATHMAINNRLGILDKKKTTFDCTDKAISQTAFHPSLCPYKSGSNNGGNPLNLKTYERLFFLYGIGIILSLISFLIEFTVNVQTL